MAQHNPTGGPKPAIPGPGILKEILIGLTVLGAAFVAVVAGSKTTPRTQARR